jgi:signal transduction histidine kinase/FixJ family two-component response regulator
MKKKRQTSLLHAFLLVSVLVAVAPIVTVGLLWFSSGIQRAQEEAQRMRRNSVRNHRNRVRSEVERAIEYMQYQRSLLLERAGETIRQRVEMAADVAHGIHSQYAGTMPDEQIRQAVVSALRGMQWRDGQSYIWITDFDGTCVLYPPRPDMEGQNLLGIVDARGESAVRRQLALVRREERGFSRDWFVRPDDIGGEVHEQLAFVMDLKLYNWTIGNAEFIKDVEDEIKLETLRRLEHVRFGDQGYLFVATTDARALIHNGVLLEEPEDLWEMRDTRGRPVSQEIRELVRGGRGDFIQYMYHTLDDPEPREKTSYVQEVPDWDWIVGAGFYADEIEGDIAAYKERRRDEAGEAVFAFARVLAGIILIALAVWWWLDRWLSREFGVFTAFFATPETTDGRVPVDRFTFRELRELAERMNQMIVNRENAAQEVRRARDEAERADRAKSEFLARMSHEIRTPMNGVMGMAQLLEGTELAEDQQEFVKAIRASAEALLALINDILDLSKVEAGEMHLHPARVSVRKVCDEVMAVVRARDAKNQVSMRVRVADDVPESIVVDPQRLRQVLTNLVGNALKFTPRGRVTIEAEVPPSRRFQSPMLRMRVTDTGIGIAREDLDSVFERFSQGSIPVDSLYGGTGLGLSICRELVQLMGGTIGVESQKDVGSTFTFEIPFSYPESAEHEETEASRVETSVPLCVLLAEDNRVNQTVAERMLAKFGCEVDVVANGKEAVQCVREKFYGAVFMDCLMPVMDGYEATQEIRRWERAHTNGRHTWIIAMTANAMEGDRDACLAVGMDDYVAKPIDRSTLHDALRRVPPMTTGAEQWSNPHTETPNAAEPD